MAKDMIKELENFRNLLYKRFYIDRICDWLENKLNKLT